MGRVTGNCADLTSSNPGYRLHGPRESSQRRAPDARQGTVSPACCARAGRMATLQVSQMPSQSSSSFFPGLHHSQPELVAVPRPGPRPWGWSRVGPPHWGVGWGTPVSSGWPGAWSWPPTTTTTTWCGTRPAVVLLHTDVRILALRIQTLQVMKFSLFL